MSSGQAGHQAASPEDDERLTPGRIARGALRGAIAAMTMTGMRAATISLGLVDEPPPRAILRQKSRGVFRLAGKRPRRAVQELMHWGYGAAGGAGFAAIPAGVRRKPWFGPVYGLVLWLGFEVVQAPLMGLKQAGELRPVERAALAADHVVYGYVLSEMRRVSS
ncbi:MAG TPA: hypothetical protein VEX39_08785 [Thermoleophilaceae bacterium]|nr:hypothetical protein [Thermoleophilaceae bacterium]